MHVYVFLYMSFIMPVVTFNHSSFFISSHWLKFTIKCPFISTWRTPFNISYEFVRILSVSVYLEILISLSVLKNSLATQRITGWQSFYFNVENDFWPPGFLISELLSLLRIPCNKSFFSCYFQDFSLNSTMMV